MAKNREPEKPVESESESGEDDDEASSDEVGSSDSDTEPEQTPVATAKPLPAASGPKKPQPVLKTPPPSPSSEEEDEEEDEEEESGSEAESDDEPANPNVKPIVSKPMDEPQKPATSAAAATKPRSKPNASQPSTQTKAAAGFKRAAEEKEVEAKDNKRSKKKPSTEAETAGKTTSTVTEDSKKQLFQRLWSEDDEIVVLKGMIDYAAKKQADPIADLNDFHDFIRSNLHVDVNRGQLQDKIRRLRKKYENNKSKEKNGKERIFTKAHEQKAYELSKKIWGSENDNGGEEDKAMGSPKANGTAARKTPSRAVIKVENSNSKEQKSLEVANPVLKMMAGISNSGYSGGGLSTRDWILKMGVEYFEGESKAEGYEEWMKLRAKEIELEDKRLELMRDQTKLVLNVFKSSN